MDRIQLTATYPNVTPENRAEFRRVAAQSLEIAKGEPGVLQFDWFFNDDETRCVMRETYESSEAVLEHVASIGDIFGRLIELGGGFQLEVFGSPSPQLLEAGAVFQPTVYSYFQGK